MDSQTIIQIDASSNQGCKASLQDNTVCHLEDEDIIFELPSLLPARLLSSLFWGKACENADKLGTI